MYIALRMQSTHYNYHWLSCMEGRLILFFLKQKSKRRQVVSECRISLSIYTAMLSWPVAYPSCLICEGHVHHLLWKSWTLHAPPYVERSFSCLAVTFILRFKSNILATFYYHTVLYIHCACIYFTLQWLPRLHPSQSQSLCPLPPQSVSPRPLPSPLTHITEMATLLSWSVVLCPCFSTYT